MAKLRLRSRLLFSVCRVVTGAAALVCFLLLGLLDIGLVPVRLCQQFFDPRFEVGQVVLQGSRCPFAFRKLLQGLHASVGLSLMARGGTTTFAKSASPSLLSCCAIPEPVGTEAHQTSRIGQTNEGGCFDKEVYNVL